MNFTQKGSFDHVRDQEYPAPQQQVVHVTGPGTVIVVIAILFFSLVVMYLTNQNPNTAGIGMVGSAIFFLVGVPVAIMANNGGIERLGCEIQRQTTIRQHNNQIVALQLDTALPHAALLVEPLQPTKALTAEGVQAPYDSPRFVPAIPRADPLMKASAGGWVTQLFNSDGRPNRKISPNKGNVQVSKPSDEVKEYLVSLGIISEDAGSNIYFDTTRYPVLRDAINSINTGVKRPSLAGGSGGGVGSGDAEQ